MDICPKLCKSLLLFFTHIEIVFLGIPNFSDAVLLFILFSVRQLILHFCISDTLLSYRLTVDILHLNQTMFYDPAMFLF